MLYHGEMDPVVPVSYGTDPYLQFKDKSLDYTLVIEKGLDHTISLTELQEVASFFQRYMK